MWAHDKLQHVSYSLISDDLKGVCTPQLGDWYGVCGPNTTAKSVWSLYARRSAKSILQLPACSSVGGRTEVVLLCLEAVEFPLLKSAHFLYLTWWWRDWIILLMTADGLLISTWPLIIHAIQACATTLEEKLKGARVLKFGKDWHFQIAIERLIGMRKEYGVRFRRKLLTAGQLFVENQKLSWKLAGGNLSSLLALPKVRHEILTSLCYRGGHLLYYLYARIGNNESFNGQRTNSRHGIDSCCMAVWSWRRPRCQGTRQKQRVGLKFLDKTFPAGARIDVGLDVMLFQWNLFEMGSIKLQGSVCHTSTMDFKCDAPKQHFAWHAHDEERYQKVLEVCQLKHDLYSNADTILVDNPLSALDPEVAKQLFQDCIVEFCKARHGCWRRSKFNFFSSCDTIIVLRKRQIMEQGTYTELIADKHSEVNCLLAEWSMSVKSKREVRKDNNPVIDEGAKLAGWSHGSQRGKDFGDQEEHNIGAVSLLVYWKFAKAGGDIGTFVLVYFGYVLYVPQLRGFRIGHRMEAMWTTCEPLILELV